MKQKDKKDMQHFPLSMPDGGIEAADLAVFSSAFSWFLRERFAFDELSLFSCDSQGNLCGCESDPDKEALAIAWEMKTVRTLPSGRLLIPLVPDGRLLGIAVVRAGRAGGRQNAHALEREMPAVFAALSHLKTFLLDPLTGLGNANFFLDRLRSIATIGSPASLILAKMLPQGARGDGPEESRQAATLFLACIERDAGSALPAHLGGGVFALLLDDRDAVACKKLAQEVVEKCRRDKLKQAVMGLAFLDATSGGGQEGEQDPGRERQVLDQAWNALQDARQRSTFAVVDSRAKGAVKSLALSAPAATRKLQAALPQHAAFACIAVTDDQHDSFPQSLAETLTAKTGVPAQGDDLHSACLVLPGADARRAQDWAADVQRRLGEPGKDGFARSVSIGVALYPDAPFHRSDILLNAKKALLHARFFAPGGLAVFNHVSLNVSGDIFFNEGDHFSAIREYRLGLGKKTDDVNLRNSLGVTCAHMNRHKEAIREFSRVLEVAPADFMALANCGLSSLALEMPGKAMDYFGRALDAARGTKASPASAPPPAGTNQDGDSAVYDIVLHLALLLQNDGRLQEALELLDTWSLEITAPGIKGKMLVRRGEILADKEDFRRASKSFQDALAIFPNDPNIMSLLGESFARMGEDRQVAFSLGMAAVTAEPLRAEFWRRHGASCLPYGDLDGAGTFLQKAFELDPADPRTLLWRGELELRRGKKGKAAALVRRIAVTKKTPAIVRSRVKNLLASCENRQG